MFSLMRLAAGWQTGARWIERDGQIACLAGTFNLTPWSIPTPGEGVAALWTWQLDEANRQHQRDDPQTDFLAYCPEWCYA